MKQAYDQTQYCHYRSCRLYHKTTWFETFTTSIEPQLRPLGCRLYHKTTWFETYGFEKSDGTAYDVADYITKLRGLKPMGLKKAMAQRMSCRLYHKTTWFETSF